MGRLICIAEVAPSQALGEAGLDDIGKDGLLQRVQLVGHRLRGVELHISLCVGVDASLLERHNDRIGLLVLHRVLAGEHAGSVAAFQYLAVDGDRLHIAALGGGGRQRVLAGGQGAGGSQATKVHSTAAVDRDLDARGVDQRLDVDLDFSFLTGEVVVTLRHIERVSQCGSFACTGKFFGAVDNSHGIIAVCGSSSKNRIVDLSLVSELHHGGLGISDNCLLAALHQFDVGIHGGCGHLRIARPGELDFFDSIQPTLTEVVIQGLIFRQANCRIIVRAEDFINRIIRIGEHIVGQALGERGVSINDCLKDQLFQALFAVHSTVALDLGCNTLFGVEADFEGSLLRGGIGAQLLLRKGDSDGDLTGTDGEGAGLAAVGVEVAQAELCAGDGNIGNVAIGAGRGGQSHFRVLILLAGGRQAGRAKLSANSSQRHIVSGLGCFLILHSPGLGLCGRIGVGLRVDDLAAV